MTISQTPQPELDLIGTSCPMAFVKARLFLDQFPPGEVVAILFEDTAANEPLVRSITALGHTIKSNQTKSASTLPNTEHLQNQYTQNATQIQLKLIEVQVKM